MQFLAKISGLFERKQQFALTDAGFWERWDLRRRNTRIYYDRDSAFQAYRVHELVYSCINKIADVMNDAEIIVETKNAKGEWQKKDGHLLSAMFKRPNAGQTGRDLRRLLVQSEQGVGRFYCYVNRSPAGIPIELTVLNPNRVRVEYDRSRDRIEYFEYTRKDGRRVRIKPEDLLIRRRPDLIDQFHGFAPLDACLKSVNSDLGFTDYVDAFFESDGTPSGILKILGATVNDTKREELQRRWKQKYGRGGSNQKGIAVLDQNAEYQKIGSNLDELAAKELTGRFESRICAVFGVPPNLVGAYVGLEHVTANATAKAELRNFWDNKISPELAGFREWLTWFVLPEFEDIEMIKAEKIRVGFDISQAAFLQEEVDNIHKRTRENFKAGMIKLNEAREAIGLAPDEKAGEDYYVQPSTLIAISPERRAADAEEEPQMPPALLPPGNEPSDNENNENSDTEGQHGPRLPLFSHKEKKTFEFEGLTLGREPTDLEKLLDLKSIVSDLDSEREKLIKIFSRFRKALIDEACEKLDQLAPETAHTLALVPDPKIRKEISKAIKAAFATGRAQVARELLAQDAGKSSTPAAFTKDERDDEALKFLDELTDGAISKIINEISTRAINEYLTLKLLLDYTIAKLKEILFGQSEKYIDQIAGAAANAAIQSGRSVEAENQSDVWVRVIYSAVLDANTCSPCADADGEEADDEADLPAAPNPDCEGRDKCRCFHVFVTA